MDVTTTMTIMVKESFQMTFKECTRMTTQPRLKTKRIRSQRDDKLLFQKKRQTRVEDIVQSFTFAQGHQRVKGPNYKGVRLSKTLIIT